MESKWENKEGNEQNENMKKEREKVGLKGLKTK